MNLANVSIVSNNTYTYDSDRNNFSNYTDYEKKINSFFEEIVKRGYSSNFANYFSIEREYSFEKYRQKYLLEELNKLEDCHIKFSEDVYYYLARSNIKIDCIKETINKIRKYFHKNIEISLEVISDPETNDKDLFVIIKSNLSVKRTNQLLKRFEEDWWFNKVGTTEYNFFISVKY